MPSSHFTSRLYALLCLTLLLAPLPALAQTIASAAVAPATPAVVAGVTIVGPPPPVASRVAMAGATGRVTMRATRVMQPLRIDGALDEDLYRSVPPITDFLQLEPEKGQPATEKTELWMAYDDDDLYIVVRCWDAAPESSWIINDLRRDSQGVPRSENIAFFLDTFYDHRNGFLFEINALGAIYDGTVTNERNAGTDWNPVWEAKSGRFDGGWTLELAIPFKSLRYRPGSAQVWGFNIRRTIRHKNEETFLSLPPLRGGGNAAGALFQVSSGGTIVGIEAPSGSRNLEIKPYAFASLTTDRQSTPRTSNDVDRNLGFDVKYGVRQNLTADFTYNTDFAQVEADTQQVNLTRFGLFFPEKREFFLENAGAFEFGGATGGSLIPMMFFSRRIGLSGTHAVPIDVGGRLTGKVGKVTIGALNVQAASDKASNSPATNFSVVRVKRDILRRSSVGMLFTRRSASSVGTGDAQAYGVDGAFGFFDRVTASTFAARTDTPGRRGDDWSYRGDVSYAGDRYGFEIDRLDVGRNFIPDVGRVQRPDMRRTFSEFRFSPRPRSSRRVRKYSYTANYDYITDGRGRLETRAATGEFAIEYQNSDRFSVEMQQRYELLKQPFAISRGIAIAPAAYGFKNMLVTMVLGNQRKVSGNLTFERGGFYDGTRTAIGYASPRWQPSPRVVFEPGITVNWVDLPQGRFTATVLPNRVTYTVTPRLFFSGLVQYNSTNASLSSNLRTRWEYRPGSELFVVYSDEHDTLPIGSTPLKNRSLAVKVNRLLRF